MDLDLNNVLGLFIASEMYELVALREFCKSFVLYHARDVFRSEQIVQLPEKLLLEVRGRWSMTLLIMKTHVACGVAARAR